PSPPSRRHSPLLTPAGVPLLLRIICSAPGLIAASSYRPFPATSLAPLSDPCWSAFSPLGSPSVPFTLTGWHRQARRRDSVGTKGILGDREEESAGTAVDVRFALTEMGCLGRPVNLVSAKGTWAGLRDGAG